MDGDGGKRRETRGSYGGKRERGMRGIGRKETCGASQEGTRRRDKCERKGEESEQEGLREEGWRERQRKVGKAQRQVGAEGVCARNACWRAAYLLPVWRRRRILKDTC
eukprot:6180161-Pleurochrysis_carterae.AAC.1